MANATAVAGYKSCSGVDGCCTAILQRPVLGYRITVEEHVKRNNVDSSVRLVTCNCSYSFFTEDDDVSEGRDDRSKYYDFSSYRLSGDEGVGGGGGDDGGGLVVPTVVEWFVPDSNCLEAVLNETNYACQADNCECDDIR